MADEEEGVTVEVDEPKPEGNAGADPVVELQKQYEELQAQQKTDEANRKAAEERARAADSARQQAEAAAHTARAEVADTRIGAIEQGLQNAQAASDAAENEYTAAMEAGDWKKAAGAQRRLADARTDLKQYTYQKQAWEAHLAQAQQQPAAPQQLSTGDAVEDYINRVGSVTPNSANWLRNHRDWITDKQKNAKLTSAHWSAIGEGLQVDSPQYFDHVERTIGLKTAAKTNGGSVTSARKPSSPVAPVVPSPGGTSGGGNEVRLTKGEASAATDGTLVWNYDDPSGAKRFKKGDPIGLQEMARRKRELQSQGQYDKANYEA
jgi:hypothetical protein